MLCCPLFNQNIPTNYSFFPQKACLSRLVVLTGIWNLQSQKRAHRRPACAAPAFLKSPRTFIHTLTKKSGMKAAVEAKTPGRWFHLLTNSQTFILAKHIPSKSLLSYGCERVKVFLKMRRLMPNFHSPNNQWMHNNPPRRCRHALRSLRRRYKYSILYIIYVYDAIPPAALHPTVCTQYDRKFANYWWLMYLPLFS